MENYELEIKEYIKAHRDEIVNDLCELVRIPSIAGTEDAKRVLDLVAQKFKRVGARAEQYDTYALAKFGGGTHKIGLFCHADVVPEGKNWTMCEPFEGKVIGDEIFGRGSNDDKSAIVISLWVQKIIRDLGINLHSEIVTFVGANEETTMGDIFDYKKAHTPPDISLVLDSGFPVHLGDKGILWLRSEKDLRFEDLISISGGEAVNIILKEATAKIRFSQELFSELSANEKLSVTSDDNCITVKAQGISAHGANPWGTVNGASIIIGALLESEHFSEKDKEELALLYSLLRTYDGSPLGITARDDVFGETTVTNGIVDISQDKLSFTLDIRHGTTFPQSEMKKIISALFEKHGATATFLKDGEPKAISADNKYVKECMAAYREHTGKHEAQPRISLGGTYSRYLDNAFEVGMTTKHSNEGLPSGHGSAHQSDEHISISGLLDALEIVLKMVLRMDVFGKIYC